ncbi:MAG TPA: metal-sensitive transcriptional regulator [Holophaga sp.]|jgi:DNA-binding FrmR family transcriptional regulator|nr:metal-sensitive transcriptional regulator [Holophaga sp.]
MKDCCGALRLDSGVREDARRRLLSVKGHVEGILRMLEDERVYCADVLKQVKAVDGALAKVGNLVLQSHLRQHVATAHERGDTDQILQELMEILKYR